MGQQLNRLKQDLLREGISILDCHYSEISGINGMKGPEAQDETNPSADERITIITRDPEKFKGLRNGKTDSKRGPVEFLFREASVL